MPVKLPSGPRIFVLSLFDGISALMVALGRLPCQVIAFAASEIDADCKRLVRKRWPGVMELGSILSIDHKTIDFLYLCVGNQCDLVLVAGGSPCQDLSALLAGGQGLQGDRSGLFFEIPRIVALLRSRFTCRVEVLVENVFSMTSDNRREFSRVLQCKPYLVDARFFSWCRRPRLFWISWHIEAQPGEQILDQGDFWEWTFRDLRPPVSAWVDPGCVFEGTDWLPTLTRALPRAQPPRAPAGLASASIAAVNRWRQDQHRFQVYQYETYNLIRGPDGLRLPSLTEREVLMGFPRGYISRALPPKLPPNQAFNLGCCMIGNTFNVHVITMVCHALIAAHNPATPQRNHVELCSSPPDAPYGWSDYPLFVKHDTTDTRCEHLVQEYLRLGDRGGTDIKLDLGIPFRCKAYPRAGLQSHYFTWRIIQGWPWKHSAHINCLELQSVVNSIQWRLRRSSHHRKRVLHLVDSQVVASVIAKGRTSEARQANRKGLTLKASMITSPLHLRYSTALVQITQFWATANIVVATLSDADAAVGCWLEHIFSEGEPKSLASDGLASLQFHLPALCGHFRSSWKMVKTWHRLEPPTRVVPLSPLLCLAFAGACIHCNRIAEAAALLVGFDALLRPGEICAMQCRDVTFLKDHAVIHHRDTKTGKRKGAGEMVIVDSQIAVKWLRRALCRRAPHERLVPGSLSAFRQLFHNLVHHLQLRGLFALYSLRRGGATHDFLTHGSLERTLLKGRWSSSSTARIYLQDTVATISELSLDSFQVVYARHLASFL
eukprot:Skav228171  [mRNA]  locus=scaffold1728:18157:20618:+ [translate_table: standard]